jgi:Domain of unknown function (DUF3943)
MKKILIFFFLCCFAMVNVCHLSAATDDKVKSLDSEPLPQLRLFHVNYFINNILFQLPPLFHLPSVKLYNPDKLKLFKPRPLDLTLNPKRRMGRAVLQGLGHFIYATTSYWVRLEIMKEDWEYLFTWEDQKKRFFFEDGFRFDSNTFSFNWTHSMAGAIYYNYARTNHFNPGASFAFTLASSSFWEFFVEFREVVSINDMIATPIGGVSIGESFFQLGRYFRSQRPTFINKIARLISNPIMSISDWLDRKKGKNQFVFKDKFWNDMRLYVGSGYDSFVTDERNTFVNLGIESQLILIPEYGEPGNISRMVGTTMLTQLDMGGTIGSKGLYQANIFTKATLFGYFKQDIRSTADEDNTFETRNDLVGYSFFMGASTAFEYMQQTPKAIPISEDSPLDAQEIEYLTDKYTVINLFGPSFDLSLFQKDFKLRLTADAFFDFSLIHSHAFKRYSESNTFGQTKSTLENHGYYYALGYTLSSMLQLNVANLELKGKVKYHYFNSIEGMDRFQPEIKDEDDFDLKDHRFNYDISLGYRIPKTNLQLVVGFQQMQRKGYIKNFIQEHTENRSYFQIRYLF